MKFKGTWILALIVLSLGFYAYFGEYKSELADQKKKIEDSTLVKAKVDQINSLLLVTSKEKIQLSRSTEGWKIEEPFKDWAESEAVDTFIGALVEEKSIEVAKEGDGIDWTDYGLDHPEAQLTLKTQAGGEIKIEISARKNFEGNAILRLNGEKRVLIASSNWTGRAKKTAFEFRQKNLLRSQASSIDKIKIKTSQGSVELESKEGKWILSDAPGKTLDQNKVRGMLSLLNETKATEILSDSKPSPSDLKKYGLNSPSIVIEADLKGEKWTALVAKDKSMATYGLTSSPELLMKLGGEVYDKLHHFSKLYFRDRNAPFKWENSSAAKVIEWISPLKRMKYELSEGGWQISGGTPEEKVSKDQVKDLFETIQKFETESFQDSTKGFKPETSLAVLDSEGKALFRLEWMKAQKIRIDGLEKTVHLARSNLSEELLSLDEATVQKIKLNQDESKK